MGKIQTYTSTGRRLVKRAAEPLRPYFPTKGIVGWVTLFWAVLEKSGDVHFLATVVRALTKNGPNMTGLIQAAQDWGWAFLAVAGFTWLWFSGRKQIAAAAIPQTNMEFAARAINGLGEILDATEPPEPVISAHERESINAIRIVWRRYGKDASWSLDKLLDRLVNDLSQTGHIWRVLSVPHGDLRRLRLHLDESLHKGSECRLWDVRQRLEAAFGAYMNAIRWAHVAEEEGGIPFSEGLYRAAYIQWAERHPDFMDQLADLIHRPEFEDHLAAAVQMVGTHTHFQFDEPKARKTLPGSLVPVVLRINDKDGTSSIYLRNNDRTAKFEALVSMDDPEGYFPTSRVTGHGSGKSYFACWEHTGVAYTTRVTGTSDEAVLVQREVGDGSPPTVKLLWPNCGVGGGEPKEPYESRSWIQGEEEPPIIVVVTITASELPGSEMRREFRVRSDGFLEAVTP